jgi:hypothetical protein
MRFKKPKPLKTRYSTMPDSISQDLKRDEDGNIETKPVTGWITGAIAESAVLLAIQYAEKPEDIDSGVSNQIQFVLTPQQSLELAAKLTTLANKVQQALHPDKRPN